MIHHLRGKLSEKSPGRAVLDVRGIGFELLLPLSTSGALPTVGEECRLFARLLVRESGLTLCGFLTREELVSFDLLSSVAGVGPAVALGAVSQLGPKGILDALSRADPRPLMGVKRVGRRLAERIVVELKGRVQELSDALGPEVAGEAAALSQAEVALVGLGYAPFDAAEQVRKASEALGEDAALEDLVREALQLDSTRRRA